MSTVKINGKSIELSRQEKVLFGKSGITKGDLVSYYQMIAPHMLPFMKNHPITMQRFPEGIKHEGFYQKDASDYFPSWLGTIPIEKKEGGKVNYVEVNNAAALVYLANQAVISFHTLLGTKNKLLYPDRLIFDLDPVKNDFKKVKQGAYILHDLLTSLSLNPYVMLTGSRGAHVIVFLKQVHTFDQVYSFATSCAHYLINKEPALFTLQMRVKERKAALFLDTLRNRWGAMAIAPYSVRPHEVAPVATPVSWQELKNITESQAFTIKTIGKRLKAKKDPWSHALKVKHTLSTAAKKLKTMS